VQNDKLADMDVNIQSFGKKDPNFADDPEYKIVIRSPGGKQKRFKNKDDMDRLTMGKADAILNGETSYTVVRNDLV